MLQSRHLPLLCSDAWDGKGSQEHAMDGSQKWIYLKQSVTLVRVYSPTKGFLFSDINMVTGDMASGYNIKMSFAAFLAKHACLQNVSMSWEEMK